MNNRTLLAQLLYSQTIEGQSAQTQVVAPLAPIHPMPNLAGEFQGALQTAVPVVKSVAEQVAELEAPAVQQLLAGEIDALKAKLASFTQAEEKKHPKAAEALVAAGQLLKKLFPQTAGIVTSIEHLDL